MSKKSPCDDQGGGHGWQGVRDSSYNVQKLEFSLHLFMNKYDLGII